MNKANWHFFTSNEAWKEITNINLSQSAEALINDFYNKKSKFLRSLIYLVEQSITKTKRQKRTILQIIQKNQARVTPHPVKKKAKTEVKSFAKKNKKEDLEILPALSTAIHL